MSNDPAETDGDAYTVIFENDRVRVLEYQDAPGHRTTTHGHPDSVIYTLSSFRRRLHADGRQHDVELPAGFVGWVPAQEHAGENIGDTRSHAIFVELKETPPSADALASGALGPEA
jgi:beta-alanine degradation protein BauB